MLEDGSPEPIAIVGMGCRWAGGVQDVTGLWEFLINKRSGYQDWAEPRFSAEGFYHPNPDRPGTTAAKGGYVVTQDPRLFDPAFFGISGLEAETIDPSQRKLLEVIYEAFESAGDTWESVNGTRTGVYVADISYDNSYAQTRDWEYARPHATTGVSHNILSNRINYVFNLRGPSVTLDSACTSAMYGLHMAIQAIREGDCDSAIVATANWIMDPSMQIAMDKLGALSATSMSHAFDASADGYARGEGFAAIYLKSPRRAMQDLSPIRALVRGSAIGANGRSNGITHPSGTAQQGIIRQAYKNAGNLNPAHTAFLECHGTGTRVGDPLEVAAAGAVFGVGRTDSLQDRLLIGSVKTNLGHTEGAAALAGIFKAVLALEAGLIPPSIGVKNLNPLIDFKKAKAEVVTEVVPWPHGKLRRASVTSAGFGGSIGHCILDHVNVVYPGYVKPGIAAQLEGRNDLTSAANPSRVNDMHVGSPLDASHLNGSAHTDRSTTDGPSHTNGLPQTNGSSYTNGSSFTSGFSHTDESTCTNGSMHMTSSPRSKESKLEDGSGKYDESLNRRDVSESNPNGPARHPDEIREHHPVTRSPPTIPRPDATTRQFVLLAFSAHHETSLQANIARLSAVIDEHSLADVAYTLAKRRSKLMKRSFRIVETTNASQDLLEHAQGASSSDAKCANLGFVFTGQGAQWPHMGIELFAYHVFRTAIAYMDRVLQALPQGPTWKIADILGSAAQANRVSEAEISQTVCTAVQIALVDLLASWSIRPAGVIGHSSGEIAAAYAAGYMTAAESITAAYFRGIAVSGNKSRGAMLAVGLTLDQAKDYLQGHEHEIKIAAINSSRSLTLSGDEAAIKKLSSTLAKDEVFNRLLQTGGNAYHSHHMSSALGQRYNEMLTEGLIHLQALGLRDENDRYSKVLWVSSVNGRKQAEMRNVPESYWRENLESPVRFSDALVGLVQHEDIEFGALLEIGPHPALKGPVEQTLKGINNPIPYVGTLKRGTDGGRALLQAAGLLYSLEYAIDLTSVNATDDLVNDGFSLVHGVTAVDLPPYSYNYGPISYYENRASREYRLRKVPRHDLVGSKIPGNARSRPQFRNVLRIKDLPWLVDHRLLPDVVFPAAGYMTMAMVAASQIHNAAQDPLPITGYALRNVDIKTALKIPEDQHGIETILTLELLAGTPMAWTDFTVFSVAHDSDQWTEHCTGTLKVEVGRSTEAEYIRMGTELRPIDSRTWYKTFAAIGLGYGPTFQALSELTADPAGNTVAAKLNLRTTSGIVKGGESWYPIHPASLDAMIQLGLIACHHGQMDQATTAFVPTHLSYLYLKADISHDWGRAISHGVFRGLRSAYLNMQLSDQADDLLLDVRDLRCTSYSLSGPSAGKDGLKPFASPFTRMIYRPDFRTLSRQQAQATFPSLAYSAAEKDTLKRLEDVATAIAVDFHGIISDRSNVQLPMSATMSNFSSWIQALLERTSSSCVTTLKALTPTERRESLKAWLGELDNLVEVKALRRIHENMLDLLQGRKNGDEVLTEGGLLADFFNESLFLTGAHLQLTKLLDCASHATPGLRILELRGGRGQVARMILDTLRRTGGIKNYQEYTVTDVSEAALQAAKGMLTEYQDVSFSTLDIDMDPLQQGFEPVYDLVIASQVVHACSFVNQALGNVRRLLRPGGKLVLVEATEDTTWLQLIGGVQAGYWHGERDGRKSTPFLGVSQWDKALRTTSFSGAELTLSDYPPPSTLSTVIVSTRVESNPHVDRYTNEVIWLLHGDGRRPAIMTYLAHELERRGAVVKSAVMDDCVKNMPTDSRVIAFLENANLLLQADDGHLQTFKYLAHHTSSMMWLTSTGMATGRSPDGAVVGGLLRTISTEAPSGHFVSVDMDATDFQLPESEMPDLIRVLADTEQELQGQGADGSDVDREFSWHSGRLWVSRLVPEVALKDYAEAFTNPSSHGTRSLPMEGQGPVRAAFETPGILNSLYFRPYAEILQTPLPEDYIEVRVAAVGLNWKDLALATGRFDGDNLSSEYAGVVTAVGRRTGSRFALGDQVYGLGRGHFGNYSRVPAGLAQRLPRGARMTEVATMPVVFMTAVYAFEHLTRLRGGQKVLIQSASGGVGLAAIELARTKGAEVFAMVGTTEKMQFLVDTIGIPSSNIFVGRGPAGLTSAVSASRYGGFDVILSTAQGDMLYESIKALAPMGHLIDLGRVDVNDAGRIGLELFQKSATFSSFDLGQVVEQDPQIGAQLMQSVNNHLQAGTIHPIHPLAAFDVSQLDQALSKLSKGTHVGKLVVTYTDPASSVRMVPAGPMVTFKPDACYVITGGLSGLGRSIIGWMSGRGARQIVVLSRRGISAPEAQILVDAHAEHGVTVRPIACDLSSPEQVRRAVQEASAIAPVKGVVHCAVSYQDVSFEKLTLGGWHQGLAAKVLGTRNLHEATIDLPLDFFVMTTSILSVLSFATQSAYTAANNFQDHFARYRRRLGLPATAAQFGLVNDVGHLSTDVTTLELMARNQVLTVPESYFLRLLEPAFLPHEAAEGTARCSGIESDALATATYVTYMDPAHMASKRIDDEERGVRSVAPPRWNSDARVSHVMRAFEDALRSNASRHDGAGGPENDGKGSRSATARLRREFDEAVAQAQSATDDNERGEKRSHVVELATTAIVGTVAGMLLMDTSSINSSRAVSDHGVDSLIAAELRNWFQIALGSKISMVDLLDQRMSISMLASKVVNNVLQEKAATSLER